MREDQEDGVISRLRIRFPDSSPLEIERLVHDSFERRSDAPVQDFVPLIAEREVKQRLEVARSG